MEVFIVDGAKQNLADIIISNKISGKTCTVASWGFGVRQVERLIDAFDQLLLVADASHSQLNTKAYGTVVEMSENLEYFTFRPTRTHMKLALVDDELIIFTSANLSANRRLESYMIGNFGEVNGIENIKEILGDPGMIFREKQHTELMDMKFMDIGELGNLFEDMDTPPNPT